MVEFLITLIALFVLFFFVEKRLGIKRENISGSPGKTVERRGRTIILVLYAAAYLFALIMGSDILLQWLWPLLFIGLMGFQAIVEWKYLRESKQYLSTVIGSVIIMSILFTFY
jgi:dolichyl-phosphate-mannose--protein O-mannosyl transferase